MGPSGARPAVPPPILLFACLAPAAALQYFEPMPIASYSFNAGMLAGAVLMLCALALAVWGIAELKSNRTPLEPGHVPSRLVTSGPYRFTRNPLYVALLLVNAGLAAMVNSAWFLAGAAVLLLLLDRLVVSTEESTIRATFGAEYDAYVARVRRWI